MSYRTATDDMIADVNRYDPEDKMATLREIAKKLKNFDPSQRDLDNEVESDDWLFDGLSLNNDGIDFMTNGVTSCKL